MKGKRGKMGAFFKLVLKLILKIIVLKLVLKLVLNLVSKLFWQLIWKLAFETGFGGLEGLKVKEEKWEQKVPTRTTWPIVRPCRSRLVKKFLTKKPELN